MNKNKEKRKGYRCQNKSCGVEITATEFVELYDGYCVSCYEPREAQTIIDRRTREQQFPHFEDPNDDFIGVPI